MDDAALLIVLAAFPTTLATEFAALPARFAAVFAAVFTLTAVEPQAVGNIIARLKKIIVETNFIF